MSKFLEVFANELALIKDIDLRNHVVNIIKICPDYILRIPSSSTGKYHPPDEVGNELGMTVHIKRICALAPEMVRKSKEEVYPETNYLVAGALLHDIFKNGNAEDGVPKSKWTDKKHPQYIFQTILDYVADNKIDGALKEKLLRVAKVCLFHEGRWTTETSKELFKKSGVTMDEADKQLCKDMHELDYWVSRRTMFDIMKEGFGV